MTELSKAQARAFILAKQGLLGSYRFSGKEGAYSYIRQAGCIQYDPVDVCGKNAELTLQSRVKGFRKPMLAELLYRDRLLVDYDCSDYEGVPTIDAMATQADDGSLTVFCVNRDLEEDCVLDLDLRSFGPLQMTEHIVLHHDDVHAVNTEDAPHTVFPASVPVQALDGGRGQIRLSPLSWNVLRFSPA